MKEIFGEITFDVSIKCSGIEEVQEKINEWIIGNKELTLVDDYGNEIGTVKVHNVEVNWTDDISEIDSELE